MEDKKGFVENELSALMHRIYPDIVKTSYERCGAEEFVYIHYKGFTKKICITVNSLWAIAMVVINEI